MYDFIPEGSKCLELGAGIGVSKDFMSESSLAISDYADLPWLDLKFIDAMDT
jgi:hypothetical protein